MIVYSSPTMRGTKLKTSKRYRAFFKELRIILVKGFIVELMTATRPPYPLSFRHLEDINQCNWDVEKKNIVVLMLAILDF